MNLMDSFSSTRELIDYASKNYSRQLTTADIRSMRKRRLRSDSRSDAGKVRDALEAHGAVEIGLDGDVVCHVFFAPKLMASSIERLSDIIFDDAKHQLNCGVYVLWHAMLVEDVDLGRSYFYAILSTESGKSYKSSAGAMAAMLCVFKLQFCGR